MEIATLIGGIGIFLLGMTLLTDTLKKWAGTRLRHHLNQFTDGSLSGATLGALLTALFQSSTVTTLMTIGFVGAGLITFTQSLPLVIGANLGSATTGWIIAVFGYNVDVRQLFLPLIGLGMGLRLSGPRFRRIGLLFVSIGLIFVGIGTLQEAMQSMVTFSFEPSAMSFTQQALLIGIGLLMTVVLQSSTIGLVLTMTALATAAISLSQAAFLILGQSAGTSLVVALGSLGGWKSARRIVLGHAIYHVSIALIGWLAFPILFSIVNRVADAFGWNDLLRLALFHTTFYILGVLLFLPFYQAFARQLLKWIPSRSEKLTHLLDNNMSQLPTVALEAARRSLLEIERYLGSETELLVREGRLREDELILVDKTLSDVRVFLSTIRLEDDGKRNDYGQHLSLLHTIDHLERWLYVLREVEPVHVLRDTDFLVARELVLHELDLVNQLNHHTPPEDSKLWKQASKQLAEYRKAHRSELLEETAANQLEMDLTIQKVQVLLWLDRIGYHIWRATRHLIKPTVPSERFDVNKED
ncbi:Na/Pi symporter [Exiguobacterium marinum]|uniref:Na/Pi symporter n=1 Tax=Exiguobacterium marinum TaxID=273528 RepID=A0ABY7WYG0_9BACL|nr:Na/Pi symporter [Exiguobacterium marinum]WDH75620.1 Na/Pi symporter [Exiguobacterium marinum]